jgi:hypothetical protein
MGACFVTMTANGDRDTVKMQFEREQDNDRYENGHSYSGGLGMASGLTFVPKTFATEKEAYEWLCANAQKWEDALAVKITGTDAGTDNWLIGAWCSS